MHSSNNNLQPGEVPHTATQGDPTKDHQLELEIQAFAELLIDIYEYRYHRKHRPIAPQSAFDDDFEESKMK
jgi:hypothetical protein